MRLAVLGFSLESNTFSDSPASLAAFREGGLLLGQELLDVHHGGYSSISGFIDAAEERGIELDPVFYTFPTPAGTMPHETFEALWLLAEQGLRQALERGIDGVLLAQHGSAVSERYSSADGEFVHRVRRLVGDLPIAVACDLHANLSQQLVESVDVLTLYRTNPHVDAAERGRDAALILARFIEGGCAPTISWTRIPAAIGCLQQSTQEGPLAQLLGLARELSDAREEVLDFSVSPGHVYADVEHLGMSVVVMTDGSKDVGDELGRQIAAEAWDRRHEFLTDAPEPTAAFQRGLVGQLVVLLDVGDNVGGGSKGQSTTLLAAAIDLGIPSFLCTWVEPETADAAAAAGLGGRLMVRIPELPAPIQGVVVALGDGNYEEAGRTHAGWTRFHAGSSAVVKLDSGQTVVVHSLPVLASSLMQFITLGVDVTDYSFVAMKGVFSPRPAFAQVHADVEYRPVNTPGITDADFRRLPFRRRPRPLYPFDSV